MPEPRPSAFDAALEWVLEAEGPDTNDPNDPGGHTRFGIAQNRHPGLDVSELTLEGARRIYRRSYWNPLQCESLPRPLAIAAFDSAVNQGVRQAALILQDALGVRLDGQIGPVTVTRARQLGGEVLPAFLLGRAKHYIHLVDSRPAFRRYLNGWLGRLFRLQHAIAANGNAR